MRLRDLQSKMKEVRRNLQFDISPMKEDDSRYVVTGLVGFRYAMENLEKLGIYKSYFIQIKEIESFVSEIGDTCTLSYEEARVFRFIGKQIITTTNEIIILIAGVLPEQDPNSLSLKLPKINDLKELAQISEKLDIIFEQIIVNDFVKGETSLQNFDTGPEWIEIVFNSAKAAGIITSIVYASILLKIEQIKNKELLEVVKNRRIDNNIYESLSSELLEKNKQLLDSQTNDIAREAGAKEGDRKYCEKIKYSIDEISKLIDKGLQFFPSSKYPSEIVTKLPDFSKNSLEEMLPEVKKLPEEASENNN